MISSFIAVLSAEQTKGLERAFNDDQNPLGFIGKDQSRDVLYSDRGEQGEIPILNCTGYPPVMVRIEYPTKATINTSAALYRFVVSCGSDCTGKNRDGLLPYLLGELGKLGVTEIDVIAENQPVFEFFQRSISHRAVGEEWEIQGISLGALFDVLALLQSLVSNLELRMMPFTQVLVEMLDMGSVCPLEEDKAVFYQRAIGSFAQTLREARERLEHWPG